MLGIYEREINMFEHVIPGGTSQRSCTCHVALRGEGGAFVLVMEDMSRNWDVGDQVVGATLAQAEAIVDALAPFHAHWWESAELAALDWLPNPDAPQYVAAVPQIYAAGLEPLQNELERPGVAGRRSNSRSHWRRGSKRYSSAPQPGRRHAHPHRHPARQHLLRPRRFERDRVHRLPTRAPRPRRRRHRLPHRHQRAPRDREESTGKRSSGAGTPASPRRASTYDVGRRRCSHYREAALYYLSGAMSLIGTFDAGNDRGAAMANAYATRILEHVVDIDAGRVL